MGTMTANHPTVSQTQEEARVYAKDWEWLVRELASSYGLGSAHKLRRGREAFDELYEEVRRAAEQAAAAGDEDSTQTWENLIWKMWEDVVALHARRSATRRRTGLRLHSVIAALDDIAEKIAATCPRSVAERIAKDPWRKRTRRSVDSRGIRYGIHQNPNLDENIRQHLANSYDEARQLTVNVKEMTAGEVDAIIRRWGWRDALEGGALGSTIAAGAEGAEGGTLERLWEHVSGWRGQLARTLGRALRMQNEGASTVTWTAKHLQTHPNASTELKLAAATKQPLRRVRKRTERWNDEQLRLAGDLAKNWAGSFEEFVAVVET